MTLGVGMDIYPHTVPEAVFTVYSIGLGLGLGLGLGWGSGSGVRGWGERKAHANP